MRVLHSAANDETQTSPQQSGPGTRRANTALVMMYVSIAALAVNIFGASIFWISLPEKLKNVTAQVESQGVRLNVLESQTAGQAATLARVDERTKSIQDDVRQLHQDFSFRASASPK